MSTCKHIALMLTLTLAMILPAAASARSARLHPASSAGSPSTALGGRGLPAAVTLS